ncbi:MAG: lysozyme [Hyphomonadaceae bacterium]
MPSAISQNGLALIREYEGFQAEPAQLPDGNWVVGYGHVRVGDPGAAITEADAADLLALDLAPIEQMVNAAIIPPLTQSQFDALVSFALSVGADAFRQSQVLRRVNAGAFVAAACAMDAWRKSEVTGEAVVMDVLVRRRAAEKALFLKDMPHDAAPSAFMRATLDHAASILGAPVAYVAAPAVGSIPVVPPKPEPAQRLTEILKAEPATEALLLTQVVAMEEADEDEIVTAHAKPVARSLDQVREATRRAYAEAQAAPKRRVLDMLKPQPAEEMVDRRIGNLRRGVSNSRMPWANVDFTPLVENAGLIGLLLFGFVLVGVGGSLLFDGELGMLEMLAAAGLALPGIGAVLIAAIGLWRNPHAGRA